MSDQRTDLLSLTPEGLQGVLAAHFEARGQPSYRADQVRGWIYERLAASFEEMTNLPLEEREALEEAFRLAEPEMETVSRSEDGTAKHLWRCGDGELVESVLIPTAGRLTLCISSQAGCAMGCTFCATGWAGFGRNLTAGEIVAQYRASRRWAEEEGGTAPHGGAAPGHRPPQAGGREAAGSGPITNIVFMGMGEPLANRKALHPALTTLNRGYGVGARRITVSTVGVVPGILELAERPEQFRLAVSLHAPTSELRREIIPLEKRWPLPELMDALGTFDAAGGKRITFEYTMIRGVNDDLHLAPKLAELAASLGAFVNLIPFNPIPYVDWEPSTSERIADFEEVLRARGVSVAVRQPRGRDIEAACGQLRARELVKREGSAPTRSRPRSAPSGSR